MARHKSWMAAAKASATAKSAGALAYKLGLELHHCPYKPINAMLREAWLEGFNEERTAAAWAAEAKRRKDL